MTATAERYERYAAALTGYAGVLEEAGPRLRAARDRLRQACDQPAQPAATDRFAADRFAADRVGTDRFAADRFAADRVGTGQPSPELLAAAREFKAGYDQWADALDRCTRALTEADRSDPSRDRHGWSALGHHLAGVAGAALSPFEQAVAHPSLGNISHCLSSLNAGFTVLGLGLLLICPAAGMACLAAATVLAAAQLAIDATRRQRGEHLSTASLGLEMAAAIPIGGNAVRGLRAADNVTHLVPGGLMAHEGIGRGHTLAKHVGKTEDFLRNRLATEPGIQAASTFYDRRAAEQAISELLHSHRRTVNGWLVGQRWQLTLTGRSNRTLGLLILRGSAVVTEESGIKVILRRTRALGVGFYVHTAMVIE